MITRLYVIVDKNGVPVGMPYLRREHAARDIHNAVEDFPEDRPFRVAEFRVADVLDTTAEPAP